MQWDFWTLSPESAHQVAFLMTDRGIPRTWRHMNGYSSHTYMWINAQGERFWVKYHFKTDQGIDFLTQEDADRLAGEDGDYHQRDLYTSIEDGNFPSWTLHVQIMPFEEAKTYRINPFDLTKVWPHRDYPLQEVGKLVLDRNFTDHHTEIEQAAFAPSNQVPGTGLSPDKMLLGRSFAYADAHRARLGSTTSRSRSTRPSVRCIPTPRMARCGSATPPIRCMRPTPTAVRRPTRAGSRSPLAHRRRDDASRLHPAARGRRLEPGRRSGPRHHGRRCLEAIGEQRRWARFERCARACAIARVRVLEEHRRRAGQKDRGRRPRATGVIGT